VATKKEEDSRPLLETILNDLLSVSTFAPVEWPVATSLLSVLGCVLTQQLNGTSSSSSSSKGSTLSTDSLSQQNSAKATEQNIRIVAMDIITMLSLGLKHRESILDSIAAKQRI
ncbi:unnamed protein product, partial [Protopolystoma xenopodis]